jgi:LuxR family transcriptional regulator, maltose regulon positive regulatory protein
MGDLASAEQALAGLDEGELDAAEARVALAVLRLAQEALAYDALGDREAAERALERALDLADPDGLLAGRRAVAGVAKLHPPAEPLSESETRVLRYLPTNLSKREIAAELCVTVHTVKTHTHHLYAKLSVHSRREAVNRARALGLLAPFATVVVR